MSETLVFLHIPKAGGNSLNAFLLPNFSVEEIFDVNEGLDYANRLAALSHLPEDRRRSLRLVYGHLPFGVHQDLPNRCRYFTVLRHPVDRITSHYYFVKEQRKHPLHDAVVSQNLTLAEYATSGLTGELNNGMTRLISGRAESDSLRGHAPCQSDELQRALDHLDEHFDVIGLLEHIDASLQLLSSVYQWPNQKAVIRNRTKSRRPVDAIRREDREAILSMNEMDMKLYEWGKAHFSEQCRRRGIEWKHRPNTRSIWQRLTKVFS